jgi:lipopolysaccharide assembly outer membrane protein LptD (OstA)
LTSLYAGQIFTKIVLKPLNTNLFYLVLLPVALLLGANKLSAQDLSKNKKAVPVAIIKEAQNSSVVPIMKQQLVVKTTVDSIKKDSIPPKKPLLEGKIKYSASNYVKIEQKKKRITLYDNAELYYQDTELKSGIIVMNYETNEVLAGRIKDSLGKPSQYPNFKQAGNIVEPDSIRFNYKSKKAIIWNSKLDQGEFKVKAVLTKKENDSVYFLKNARFSTSQEVDNPEYYFRTSKVKIMPGKKVVTGLTNLVIANVPTPIALPFAFFPLSKETSVSGIILPSYNNSNNRGFSLQNGGYYFALTDNYDLTVLGDYYTNGSYATRFESSYAKRYGFRGNINVRYENLISGERGLPDYSKSKIYNIQWSHSKDSKGSPNSTFSASVNLGSSRYFQQSLNQLNIGANLNNTLNSSVSYSKTFPGTVGSRLSLNANHSQNTRTSEISMTLPDLQYSIDRMYPFVGKDGVRKGIFKNINLLYNLVGKNSFVTTDSLFFSKQMFENARLGFQHSIPITTNFKLFKYLSATSSFNYNEVWAVKTIRKSYDKDLSAVVDKSVNGFDAFRTYNFATNIGTTVYGTFNFRNDSKIKSIRHVMRPSISYSYVPDFEKYFDTYATDGTGRMMNRYTRFEGGVLGVPTSANSNFVGFDLSNTFEAKITDPDSTKVEPKKIMLLNNFNFNTSYDANANGKNTQAWTPVRVTGGTVLFKDKLNVNFGATLDPYAIDNTGIRLNTFNIANGGSIFRMTSANLVMNYALSNKKSEKDDKDKKNEQSQRNGGRDDDLFGRNTVDYVRGTSQFEDKEKDSDAISEFFASKLPWNMTLAYSLTYTNVNRENKITGSSLMVSANGDLSPQWKVGVSTGYDFVLNGVTYTQLRFERDLLSWRMDFNWQPFGQQANWNFFIGISAGILSDLKYDKRSAPLR